MAKAVQQIALSPSRDIPFNKLVLSQSNVRRIKAGVSIEALAEDIARRTLLQSINVRAVRDADGVETGIYEIPAGGRRYRALELLVKQKRLAKTTPIPCIVREDGIAEEDSLAENVQRAPLHPLDQFRAFRVLRDKGQSEEEIAAAFFVSAQVVKQRLRLAGVSEKLLDLYAEDAMTLDHVMAFTVSDDHKRQEQVWKAVQKSWNKDPHQIRRMLTEKTVPANDKRVRFVGVAAYEAAGGIVLRDLFQDDRGGWLHDPALLDCLVTAKLKAEAEAIGGEGWKWIEVDVAFPYGHTDDLRAIAGEPSDLTKKERTRYDALKSEFAQLEAQYADAEELPEEIDARLGEIETALEAFDARPMRYGADDIARAGAFVSIDGEGQLRIERGFVRPEDELAEESDEEDGATETAADTQRSAPQRAVITIGAALGDGDEEEDDGLKPLADRLLGELTAHRTLALRDALASHPHVAMTVLLHKLCCDAFFTTSASSCLDAGVRRVSFPVQAPDLKGSSSAAAIEDRHTAWKADMPADEAELWTWLDTLDADCRAALLAHCVSFGVNALHERPNPYGGVSAQTVARRMAQAERIARAVGLDMTAAGWRPSVENYLGRVPKSRILEAVREGKGEREAQLIDHLKKAEMAKEAQRLLADADWLPEPLRLADSADAAGAVLPAFLSDDVVADAEEEKPAHAVAAA